MQELFPAWAFVGLHDTKPVANIAHCFEECPQRSVKFSMPQICFTTHEEAVYQLGGDQGKEVCEPKPSLGGEFRGDVEYHDELQREGDKQDGTHAAGHPSDFLFNPYLQG